MKTIISDSLQNAYTYLEYRNLVSDLIVAEKSTGNVQSEEILHYSKLNETRMNRLDKTIMITPENVERLKLLRKEYLWLVISEGWCGDATQILPIMHKMNVISDNIEFKVVLRDEHEDLMNLFLTDGAKSIPKLIVLDAENLEVLDTWGPRPQAAIDLVKNYKATHGIIDEKIKTDLQMWYLNDKGLSTQTEIIEIMRLAEIQE
ncbi:thioredoxin family protein [Flavobacterium sp. NST-5]|uniref:Thioredoxin family protein n=1 Tax=Flavobacterium ichthyis TaxID=2698827 RepID=A0ABW9Z6X9_9FLAO|nr:thioredoxin family protein [Flavobacterium ichthyis]NBL64628.1 thioredoxin family protein [Flavobacterium ichthyis]